MTDPRGIRRRLLLREAWLTVAGRPSRTLLTGAATALGSGLLLLVVGLTSTASGNLSTDFDALRATQVLAQPTSLTATVDADAWERVSRLPGVEAAGLVARRDPVTIGRPEVGATATVDHMALTPGAFDALELGASAGWLPSTGVGPVGDVVVVGEAIHDELGGSDLDGYAAMDLGGRPHVITAVIDQASRMPTLRHAVVTVADVDDIGDVVVRVAPGAGQQVAEALPVALSPTRPESWSASAPPDPSAFRAQIEGGVSRALLFVALSVLGMALLSIANSVLVSVMERRSELGVRRALGATSGHLRLQVLAESTLIGLVGGVGGTALAVVALVAIATSNGWTPVLPLWGWPLTPFLGAAVGGIAGVLPAARAARTEPATAMRAL